MSRLEEQKYERKIVLTLERQSLIYKSLCPIFLQLRKLCTLLTSAFKIWGKRIATQVFMMVFGLNVQNPG